MKKVLAVTTAVAVAGSFAATANAAEYTVNSGDTLWGISQQYGTSVANVKAENGLSSDLIYPTQVLKVNETAAKTNSNVYHIVAGDTLGKIASKFNVTVAQLKAWNNLSSDLIIAGKTLYVSGAAVPAQQAAPVQQAPVQQTAPVQTYQAPVQQKPTYQAPAQQQQTYQAPVQQKPTYQAPVQQKPTYQAPVQQKPTYQAPAQQQQTYQAPAQHQTYQAPVQQQAPKAATTQTAAVSSNSGLNWAAVAACESGGNPSTNTGNGYYGLYQFSLPTWQSVGGTGLPSEASAAEQTKRAEILYNRAGAGQWPVCGANL
ncbi:LysM peptidoglycan-binding domain-containing protein [Macrococcus hajekii]|uniref:LysM peptidoglycan-binding domain-containing protein n=1 Tax=Macrococcus hajekii TaxID=198482 RepID=A0A4V3BDR9_9STAP|nr:LysM peptidoglycan-binding domain-containing protein [Macrococcus hajekii]TDM01092.1 LysM peptidoglycan-binding domain-containing protein [Macrococcus hajekii]GGB12456.1 hypothetical protein GCM10007190_20740 [Macrococcus hajekii]